MPNFKNARHSEDIHRELTDILRSLKDPRIDPMLSVVRTELSRDGSSCKVYVSSLSGLETARESVKGLKKRGGVYPPGDRQPAGDAPYAGIPVYRR